jgi:hypothetical protein
MDSRAIDPFSKQIKLMKSPVGDPKTCPLPVGSTRGFGMKPKRVLEVPSEMAIRPGFTSPTPIKLQGLSPDHDTTCVRGEKPYRFTQ